MGLKFLNKKGWHTGSIRNIENVWKAEQKHDAEQRKLEELRKQIHEERERDEFRQLQQQAGLTPRQERLEFLYDSGLAVGKSSSDGFKALEPSARPEADKSVSASGLGSASANDSFKSSTPGALFEDKPQSANDAWRKLHSDPLLMIRQREQEAMARIKNNPVKMAMIRKSMEEKKKDEEARDREHQKVKSSHKKHSSKNHSSEKHLSSNKHSDSENDSSEEKEQRKKRENKKKELDSAEVSRDRSRHRSHSHREYEGEKHRHSSPSKQKEDRNEQDLRDRSRHQSHSHREHEGEKQHHSGPSKQKANRNEEDIRDGRRHERRSHRDYESEKQQHGSPSKLKVDRRNDLERGKKSYEKVKNEDCPRDNLNEKSVSKSRVNGSSHQGSDSNYSALPPRPISYKRQGKAPQLSEEERAARLREMQMDAEVHEEQRWKRLKKADEDDAREASNTNTCRGSSFLDAVQKSVYGAEKGGSSTIEESVRRRSHFRQAGAEASELNAFRR